MSPEALAAAKEEHATWTDLVRQLKDLDAVTEADANSSVNLNVTPGQRLFNTLRSWGALKYGLGAHACDSDLQPLLEELVTAASCASDLLEASELERGRGIQPLGQTIRRYLKRVRAALEAIKPTLEMLR